MKKFRACCVARVILEKVIRCFSQHNILARREDFLNWTKFISPRRASSTGSRAAGPRLLKTGCWPFRQIFKANMKFEDAQCAGCVIVIGVGISRTAPPLLSMLSSLMTAVKFWLCSSRPSCY